jgi:hypothetical protein
MKRFISIFFAWMMTGLFSLYGQGEIDALRFSQSSIVGSARAMGLAGGTSAMGADISAATLNPAGLALYRRGEMVFTPTMRFVNTRADFLGSTDNAARSKFGFSNMGMVIHTPMYQGYGMDRQQAQSGLISYVYAIGYNQLENYARETSVSGYNPSSSFTDFLAEQATGTPFSSLNAVSYPGMAWDTYSIDVLEGPNGVLEDQFFGAGTGGDLQQTIRISEQGRRNEWFFSMAANVDDFFYFGGTLGIQGFRYDQTYRFIEEDINDSHSFYVFNPNNANGFPLEFPTNSFEIRETLTVEGTGVNLKLGLMLRPVDRLRIGFSFHSPTVVTLTDDYGIEMAHNHNLDVFSLTVRDRDTVTAVSYLNNISDYNLNTPYRLNMGLMYLMGKKGFLTADVEYVDYRSAKLRSPYLATDPAYYSYDPENETIRELFSSAINTRLGVEVREDIYRIRLGVAFFGTALDESAHTYEDINNPGTALTLRPNRRLFTLGLGVRQPNYYLDVAYVNQLTKEKLNPYTTANTSLVDPTMISSVTSNSLVFTVGFRL